MPVCYATFSLLKIMKSSWKELSRPSATRSSRSVLFQSFQQSRSIRDKNWKCFHRFARLDKKSNTIFTGFHFYFFAFHLFFSFFEWFYEFSDFVFIAPFTAAAFENILLQIAMSRQVMSCHVISCYDVMKSTQCQVSILSAPFPRDRSRRKWERGHSHSCHSIFVWFFFSYKFRNVNPQYS